MRFTIKAKLAVSFGLILALFGVARKLSKRGTIVTWAAAESAKRIGVSQAP